MRVGIVGGVFGQPDLVASGFRAPEMILADALTAAGHQVHRLSHFDGSIFSRTDIDILHVHHLSWGLLSALLRSQTNLRIPVVFTPHALWADNRLRKSIGRILARQTDGLSLLCEAERTLYREGTFVRVIWNGHWLAQAAPSSTFRAYSDSSSGPLRVLYVGQLAAVKQVDVLIRAVADASETIDCSLTLVYHNNSLESNLKELVTRAEIDELVEFKGQLSGDALLNEYRGHDVVMLTSKSEVLPSVIAEATMLGLPVIAPMVGGIPEQVPTGRWLVEPESGSEEFTKKLSELYANLGAARDEAERWSSQARDRYDPASVAFETTQLYEDLLIHYRRAKRRRLGADFRSRLASGLFARLDRFLKGRES